MPGCQCRKADNGIHGGADIVGHIVQEPGLGPVGVLRRSQGISQGLLPLHFQLLMLVNIQQKAIEPADFAIFIIDRLPHGTVPLVLPALGLKPVLNVINQTFIRRSQQCPHIAVGTLQIIRMQHAGQGNILHFPLGGIAQEMSGTGVPLHIPNLAVIAFSPPAGLSQDTVHRVSTVLICKDPNR